MIPGVQGIHPVIGASAAVVAGQATGPAALVRKSSDQSLTSSFAALTYSTEVYDNGDWHDTSSNTSRLTVPAGASIIRVTSNNTCDTPLVTDQVKNGAAARGLAHCETTNSNDNHANMASAPIAVTASDYFETRAKSASALPDVLASESTWTAIETLPASLKYAVVYRSAAQSIGAGSTTTLTWNSEVVDTDGWHDTASNTSRLTVPSGVTLVRVCGNATSSTGNGQLVLNFLKNGAAARGLPFKDVDHNAPSVLNVVSAPLVVSAGDYFEMQAFHTVAVDIEATENNWFSIEEVPSTYKRALVNKSGNQSITGGVTTTLTWDQEVYDTDTIHDTVTNNSRLTVPSGVTKARPSFALKASSTTGQIVGKVQKNGADYYGMPMHDTDTAGTDNISAIGAWVDVTPGDYFECVVSTTNTLNIGTENETWFCLECQ